jgi:translation elongation factor EF-G
MLTAARSWLQVATAVRLCDGALVVVDAVEGVCIQTHAVLAQARAERVVPCLVINKMDRLVTELGLAPEAAYDRLERIVQDANGVIASLASVEFLQTADTLAQDAAFECAVPLSQERLCRCVRDHMRTFLFVYHVRQCGFVRDFACRARAG